MSIDCRYRTRDRGLLSGFYSLAHSVRVHFITRASSFSKLTIYRIFGPPSLPPSSAEIHLHALRLLQTF